MDRAQPVTGAMAAPPEQASDAASPEPEAVVDEDGDERAAATGDDTAAGTERPADPWAPLLEAGIGFVERLAAAGTAAAGDSPWVDTDRRTGQRFLGLPVPGPESVQRLAEGLRNLLGRN
jgi:hypothetical protein